jgi:hypothetical protein
MGKDFIDLTPSELNALLIKECGIDLFAFSEFAFEVVTWKKIFPERKLPPDILRLTERDGAKGDRSDLCERVSITEQGDRQILIGLKARIVHLEKKIIETMLETEALLDLEPRKKEQLKNKDEFEKKFAWEYDLESFFDLLWQHKDHIDNLLDKRKRGAPINRRNLLCSAWAQYLMEQNKVVNWNLLADLMDWFWVKFKPYEHYKDFKPTQEQTDPEHIKNQFYKQKKSWALYYGTIRPRVGHVKRTGNFRGEILVFGQRPKEVRGSRNQFMEYTIRGAGKLWDGPLWVQALDLYKSRAIFKRKLGSPHETMESAEDTWECAGKANLDWLVIFPDGTYAIDPA